jgi:hypothetical protein
MYHAKHKNSKHCGAIKILIEELGVRKILNCIRQTGTTNVIVSLPGRKIVLDILPETEELENNKKTNLARGKT